VSGRPTNDVLTSSWILNEKLAVIDTSSAVTQIPKTYYSFVMERLLQTSVGFYFDTDLQTYVLSCDQTAVLNDLYIKLKKKSSFTGSNLWLQVQPSAFISEIYDTGICQLMFKENAEDKWVIGLNLLT